MALIFTAILEGLVTYSQLNAACGDAARRDDFTLFRHRFARGASKVNARETTVEFIRAGDR
ncbi:hypothetical protein OG233_25405 [Streptomyces sp. NBC_01218]|uniref:hypothetical protein n=1 Tax=unclassified Streptomyces TaxID=2593676 RepID=UPI0023B9406D|nr:MULTISPECIES: hypothetical protein [unclassified Streptomyces]WEH42593.1 hypothetical protein PZB77_25565 [Streptomyces sp. AM 2-1-1]WSQ54217.1 hypothetical protein OG233_25405 [Streptomyces sp. NBC_01218]